MLLVSFFLEIAPKMLKGIKNLNFLIIIVNLYCMEPENLLVLPSLTTCVSFQINIMYSCLHVFLFHLRTHGMDVYHFLGLFGQSFYFCLPSPV